MPASNLRRSHKKKRKTNRERKCNSLKIAAFWIESSQQLYALTCYMTPQRQRIFLLSISFSRSLEIHAQLKGKEKIKVRAEKNLNKNIFSLFFLEWPRARDEKSRGWNFFSFHYKYRRHSSGSAIVSCFQCFMANSRVFFHHFFNRLKNERRKKKQKLKFIKFSGSKFECLTD